jgi:hypothetical protein
MRGWDGGDRYEGSIRGEDGRDYLYRLQKFSQADEFSGYSLLLAAQDDFAGDVRKLQLRGIIVGTCRRRLLRPRSLDLRQSDVDFAEGDHGSGGQAPAASAA